jgi:hypothetical protein
MNNSNTAVLDAVRAARQPRDALEARYALRVAAALNGRAEALPHDVSERLRFARERALERARAAAAAHPAGVAGPVGGGVLALGGGNPWWTKLAALAPVLALVLGLVVFQELHDSEQLSIAADIDTALLADDLPPNAYADPGFAEFLRSPDD